MQGDPAFDVVRFDVETRSKLDLPLVGAWNYSKHPSTELLTFCFALNDSAVNTYIPDVYNGCRPPDMWSRLVSSPRVLFTPFGAFFEWCIYQHTLVERFGWPPIPVERWRCDKAVAAYWALPRSVDKVGHALDLPIVKDKVGSRVMKKLTKPRKPSKNNKATYHSNPEDFETLHSYCATDVLAQRLIGNYLGDLPPGELLIWQVDQMINKRGVHCDINAVKGAIHLLDIVMGQYQDQIKQVSNGALKTTSQVKEIVAWCASQGFPIDNLQAKTVEDFLDADGQMVLTVGMDQATGQWLEQWHHQPLPDNVRAVLTLRQKASKSSVSKYQKMLAMIDLTDNRIREILLYHGAATGRWAGLGIQIQNFPKGTFKFQSKKNPDAPPVEDVVTLVKYRDYEGLAALGDIPNILSSLLRSMLCAKPGHKLIAADYSAIEARILLWLVGDEHALNIFRTGGDIYKDLATVIYGVSLADVTDEQRWVGKQGVLGLGYQMGWKKFQAQCKKYGVEISEKLAKRVVKAYRAKYPKVVDYWERVENAAIMAVQTGQPVTVGKVTYYMQGDFLRCLLPSGRSISYYKPHFIAHKFNPDKLGLAYWTEDSQTKKWVVTDTYGGKLVENHDQAIAGCILREATITLERHRVPVVLSVHDELVVEVPDNPRFTVDMVSRLLCQLSPWMKGLPLAAEGWEGQRFKK